MAASDWFWEIIGEAQGSRERLAARLQGLTRDEIRLFQSAFLDFAAELQGEPYSDYVEESEDGAQDVAEWVVSRGKQYYLEIVEAPQKIPSSVEGRGSEILSGVAGSVYFERFGELLDVS